MITDEVRPDGWQLDDAGARSYEEFLVAGALDGWARDLVATVGVDVGATVVDVGCGTGVVARHAARASGPRGRTTGVDRNRSMLALAAELSAAAGGVEADIVWTRGDAHDLQVGDDTVDVVLCQQALQFVRAPAVALTEMRRVAVPGGRLGLSTCRSLAHQPGYAQLVAVLRRHVAPEAVEVIASPYALGDPAVLRALVLDAGFVDVRCRIDVHAFRLPSAAALVHAETASSPLGSIATWADGATRAAVVDELSAALAPHTDDDGVVFPFETLTVTAVA